MLPEKAFKIIEERITQGKNIVELGSGDGTKRLSERYNVISIEHDENWISQLENSHIFAPIIKMKFPLHSGKKDGTIYLQKIN